MVAHHREAVLSPVGGRVVRRQPSGIEKEQGTIPRAHQEAPPLVLAQHRHEAALDGSVGAVGRHVARDDPAHVAVTPGPDGAIAGLVERADVVAAEAVAGPEDADPAVLDPVEAAAVGPDPDAVVARPQDRVDRVVGESIPRRVAREGDVLDPVESPLRAHPQAAFLVLVQADHVVVGQAVAARERGEPVPAHPQQPLAEGSYPEVPVAVLPDGPGRVRREPVLAREAGEHAVLDAGKAAARADPHPARAVLEDRVDEGVGQGLPGAVSDEAPALQQRQALGGPEPHVAVAVLVDRGDGAPERGRLLLGHAPSLAETPDATPARPDPEAAVRALVQGAHVPQRPVAGLGRGLERPDRPVLEPGHAARGRPDPQRAVTAGTEGEDARVAEAGGGAGIEEREADAVEANEAPEAPDPQVAVACLGDRLHELLGKTVAPQPDVVPVAVRRAAGIEGGERPGPQDDQPHDPDPEGRDMPPHATTHQVRRSTHPPGMINPRAPARIRPWP